MASREGEEEEEGYTSRSRRRHSFHVLEDEPGRSRDRRRHGEKSNENGDRSSRHADDERNRGGSRRGREEDKQQGKREHRDGRRRAVDDDRDKGEGGGGRKGERDDYQRRRVMDKEGDQEEEEEGEGGGRSKKEDSRRRDNRNDTAQDVDDALANFGRTGGVYIPPFKFARMMKQVEDKSSVEYQKMTWDALRKSINGLVNKVNATNIKNIIPELFAENLIRGRGLFCRSCLKSQMASPAFTDVFAALISVVNTKFPEVGDLLLRRIVLQFQRAFKRHIKVRDSTLSLCSCHILFHSIIIRVNPHAILFFTFFTFFLFFNYSLNC